MDVYRILLFGGMHPLRMFIFNGNKVLNKYID